MGLLEQMLARLDALEAKANGVVVSAVEVAETPAYPAGPIEAPVLAAGTALVNEHGIPWNADYHAGTQTKNQDGHWKGKKGVEKSVIEAYNAQFTAQASAPATPVSAPVMTTPAVPVVPAPPAIPAPPVVPAPPAIPAVSDAQLTTVKNIQSLTNEWKVPYANVVASLLTKHGATSFDTCDAKHHAEIVEDSGEWLELLASVDADLERMTNAAESTGNGSAVAASVATVMQSQGGSATLGGIAFDKLETVAASVKGYADQWVDYAAKVKG